MVLRTTARVVGQPPKQFNRHSKLVVRCTTVVDALARLLAQEGLSAEHAAPEPDQLAGLHALAQED